MTEKKQVTAIVTNKNLSIDYSKWKKNITSKRYSYYDFDRARVEKIAKTDGRFICNDEVRVLVQALFPQYLLCSGLFDAVVLFDVVDGVRVDPPKYWYHGLDSYLNNDDTARVNQLCIEIEDLFKQNEIEYSAFWQKYFNACKNS